MLLAKYNAEYREFEEEITNLRVGEADFQKHVRGLITKGAQLCFKSGKQDAGRLVINVLTDNLYYKDANGKNVKCADFSAIKQACRGVSAGVKRFYNQYVFSATGVQSSANEQDVLKKIKEIDIYKIPTYVHKIDKLDNTMLTIVSSVCEAINDGKGDATKEMYAIYKGIKEVIYDLRNKKHTDKGKDGKERPYQFNETEAGAMDVCLAFLDRQCKGLQEVIVNKDVPKKQAKKDVQKKQDKKEN